MKFKLSVLFFVLSMIMMFLSLHFLAAVFVIVSVVYFFNSDDDDNDKNDPEDWFRKKWKYA